MVTRGHAARRTGAGADRSGTGHAPSPAAHSAVCPSRAAHAEPPAAAGRSTRNVRAQSAPHAPQPPMQSTGSSAQASERLSIRPEYPGAQSQAAAAAQVVPE